MTTTTDHTANAKYLVGDFVQRAGKTFLVVRCGDGFGGEQPIRVTPDDVAAFFATQARNLAPLLPLLAGDQEVFAQAFGVLGAVWPTRERVTRRL